MESSDVPEESTPPDAASSPEEENRRFEQQAISSFFYASSAASNQFPLTTEEEPVSPQRMAVMGATSAAVAPAMSSSESSEMTPSLHSTESPQAAQENDVNTSRTNSAMNTNVTNNHNTNNKNNHNNNPDPMMADEGGRLWKLAGEEVQRNRFPAHFAETFMEHTRSRAVPDAVVHESERKRIVTGTVRMSGDTKAILMNTGPAHRRVRVVQLLVVGILGLFCWLGNFFVTTSCHLGTVYTPVGAYGNKFPLHYGLYKYSPADSALAGYTYCYPYTSSTPVTVWLIVARIGNAGALTAGTLGLIVLWWYLIAGRAHPTVWYTAARSGWVAGFLQMAIVNLGLVQFCRMDPHNYDVGGGDDDAAVGSDDPTSCRMGPAGWWSILTGVAWCIVGFELGYLQPTVEESAAASSSSMVTSLEMADWKGASQEYMERAFGNHSPKYTPPTPDIT